jgi:hypothetical protein
MSENGVSLTWKDIAAEIAIAAHAYYDDAAPLVEAWMRDTEADVISAIMAELAMLPQPQGMAATVERVIVGEAGSLIESQAKALVAKFGPEVIYAMIDTRLKQYTASLGG